jgi:GNAT superfamily N-acetyltransferase
MITARQLIKESFEAAKELLEKLKAQSQTQGGRKAVKVPIRALSVSHAHQIAQHLKALSTADRYLRFGCSASDEMIQRYVSGLNFDRDEIFGIYNRRLELIAMAHLAFSVETDFSSCAEFGVSVLPHARARGYGGSLFDRAVMHARNEGVEMMFIHALSENTAMLNIARKSGAILQRDGAESDAYLRLRPADWDSHMTEMFEEHLAQTDYRLKAQAKQFWDILRMMQEVRLGVREAKKRTPS